MSTLTGEQRLALESISPALLGSRLKTARITAGLKLREIEVISMAGLSRIEHGLRRPSDYSLATVAARLGADVDELLAPDPAAAEHEVTFGDDVSGLLYAVVLLVAHDEQFVVDGSSCTLRLTTAGLAIWGDARAGADDD